MPDDDPKIDYVLTVVTGMMIARDGWPRLQVADLGITEDGRIMDIKHRTDFLREELVREFPGMANVTSLRKD